MLCLAIFGVTLLAYYPTFFAGFVWNDPDYVTSPELRSLHGLWRIWFELGSTEQYYPLLHSAFWFEHLLWGDAPLGYHLVNILLHATSACLLALALRRLAVPGAWLAAFIFALHPVCVESVAWISEQKNTLSTAFFLAAGLTYLHYDQTRRSLHYRTATILFILALFSKSLTASLPAALLVIFWWQRGRLDWRRDVRPLLPWFAVGAAVGLFTAWVEHSFIGAAGAEWALTNLERGLVAGRGGWFYLGKVLWPVDLIFIYPRWQVSAAESWQFVFPLGGLALFAALWCLRHRWRGPLAAALFFAGTLFPVLGFFNLYAFRYSFVADHWQYLSMLGVIVPVAVGLRRMLAWLPARAHWCGQAMVAALLLTLGVLSNRESRTYHDRVVFYQTILDRNPACWMASHNLGAVLFEKGDLAGAIAQFTHTLHLRPENADIHENLADALLEDHRFGDAIVHYQQALQLDPDLTLAHANLAFALVHERRVPEAVAHYRQALRLNPDDPDVQNNFCSLLSRMGEARAAVEHGRKAVRLKPGFAGAHNNLGTALIALNDVSGAIACFREAVRLQPDLALAHYNLGNALTQAGHLDEAITAYEHALRVKPDYAGARVKLGDSLVQAGRLPEAVRQYEQALQLNPANPNGHNDLGAAFLQLGQTRAAIAQFTEAVRLQPDWAIAHYNLGNALAQAGQLDEAVAAYEHALRVKSDYAEARINLGSILVLAGRLPEAVRQYEQALQLNPGIPEGHYNLGCALLLLDQTHAAIAQFDEALRLRPDYPEARDKLARARQQP